MLQGRGEATAGRMAVLGMVAGYMPRGSNPGHPRVPRTLPGVILGVKVRLLRKS